MARIYISSSWKNEFQQSMVQLLREQNHKVYDFQHPHGRTDKNVWSDLGVSNDNMTNEQFAEAITHQTAVTRFEDHFSAMQDADTCILLLPCGKSSHVEAGYMKGLGKRVFVYSSAKTIQPELMYLVFDGYFHDIDDLLKAIQVPEPGVCQICGCTECNPCYNPSSGTCWWVNEERTLCSHCAHMEDDGEYCIADDPETQHCINDNSSFFV